MPRHLPHLLALALLAACTEAAAPRGPVTIAQVRITIGADSLEVGTWVTLSANVIDSRGRVRTDVPLEWSSGTPQVAEVDPAGRVRALAQGEARIHARAGGHEFTAYARAYDVPTSLAVLVRQADAADGAPVDVESRATFHAEVRGRMGRPIVSSSPSSVTWSCAGREGLWVRCDSVLVPRLQSLVRPETLQVTARAGDFATTTPVVVHELPVGRIDVRWPPASVMISDTVYFAQTAQATLGDTLRLLVRMTGPTIVTTPTFSGYPYLPNRPLRFALDDPTLATMTLGDTLDGSRIVKVVGLRAGTTRMRVLVNGAAAGFHLRVAARASSPCAQTTGLDMAVGELRMIRGTDASQCIRFERARDAGRAYVLVSDALPLETSRFPNAGGLGFDFEGQGLFRRDGAAEPRAFPIMRIYVPGASPEPTTALRAPAEVKPHFAWAIGGSELREHPVIAPTRRSIPAALGAAQSGLPAIQVGDTLDVGDLFYLDPRLGTADGGARDKRVVVVHVGPRLVAAELVDVLRGRLRYTDGTTAAPIPGAARAQLETEYAVAARQLDRLFPGTPVARQAYGRDFGRRELFVNVPLQTPYAGYATPDYVAADFGAIWQGTARAFSDFLLAHEFAHMRHMSGYWPGPVWHPWQVEGLANFAERLTMTARMTGTDAPSRTAGFTQILDANLMPVPWITYTNSLFQGYNQSAYVYDYLADQVAAGGRDGLAAVRALAAAGSAAAADAAIDASLPGMGVHELVVRSRVAAVIEQLRFPNCGSCLKPEATTPLWTRYLQYRLQSIPFGYWGGESLFWPVLRPGTSSGIVAPQRTGTIWPTLIDGRDATSDATWVLDFREAPQTTVSLVRIR